jgi:O-antigen biosynthesis protein
MIPAVKRIGRKLRDEGLGGIVGSPGYLIRQLRRDRKYARWIKANELTGEKREELKRRIDAFERRLKISILLPVYNVDEKWLRLCIDSVLAQIYPDWELCIADDCSTDKQVRPVLSEYAGRDERIKVVFRAENGHISAASNSALELAEGEFTVLLDHDDELSEDALFWVADEIDRSHDAAIIYSDEDVIDERGRRHDPKFKPEFSRDLFYSFNLLTHLSAFRTGLLRSIGGFRVGFEGSQDYDLALRAIEQIDEHEIRHIPRVLYHWRAIRGSVAYSMDEKPYAHENARRALREHFARTGRDADVVESFDHLHRVAPGSASPSLVVSVIVSGAISPEDIERLSHGEAFEIISVDADTSSGCGALNKAVKRSQGEALVFLDADLNPVSKGAIATLASFATQPQIGAAGAKILASNRLVEQTGIVLSPAVSPVPAHGGFPRMATGDMSRNRQIGNFSAISGSCMAIRRELFESTGGFDAAFPGLFDIDLCLRLREQGFRIVVLPHVEFVRTGKAIRHHSSNEAFRNKWRKYAAGDPFCNPNLKRDGSFEIDV